MEPKFVELIRAESRLHVTAFPGRKVPAHMHREF
jgi:hypothetical protein